MIEQPFESPPRVVEGRTGTEVGQNGVVLFVDDEPDVRQFAVETLQEAGFDTLGAGSADDALRTLEQRPDVTVLVTDVRMPGPVNGYFLARKVRERWPHVEIILVSGYAAPQRGDISFDCDLLVKPFQGEELVRRVSRRARQAAA